MRLLSQGTVSILFGCHSPVHSVLVTMAWKRIYGKWPRPWQTACIFLHDVGHLGKNYLDDAELKKHHHELGARIAGILFGNKGCMLVSGHNAYVGQERSELFYADKASWLIAPVWWIVITEFAEPKLQHNGFSKVQSAYRFKSAMRNNWKAGFPQQGHDIYLQIVKGK